MNDNPYDSPQHLAETPEPEKKGFSWITVLAAVAVLGLLFFLFLIPARRSAPEAARRNQCINNLKNIGLALQTYHDAHGEFPPAYTVDANGKPLHSWRTLILPYVEEQQLYDSIDLTKPWDDPVNAQALNTPVIVYRCPSGVFPENYTSYLAIVTEGSCLRPAKSLSLNQVTDKHSQTAVVIEVAENQAVPWMAPQDASEELLLGLPKQPKWTHTGNASNVSFADGHVTSMFFRDKPAETLKAIATAAGGEQLESEE